LNDTERSVILFLMNSTAASRAARAMGRRSAEVRLQALGEKEFVRRMREIGKLGGRPKKVAKSTKAARQ
jgi:hypothetical protein